MNEFFFPFLHPGSDFVILGHQTIWRPLKVVKWTQKWKSMWKSYTTYPPSKPNEIVFVTFHHYLLNNICIFASMGHF